MGLEQLETVNADALNQEISDNLISDLYQEEEAESSSDEPSSNESVLDSEEQESDTEGSENLNEDIPNASIRLEKMRSQRDEERQQRFELEKRLAELTGKISVLENSNKDNEDSSDPTEYMSDTEKYLYNQNKGLQENIKMLTDQIEKVAINESTRKLQEEEDRFLESNPDLKKNKDQFVDEMLGYLKDRPQVKQLLADGKIKLAEVYGMYKSTRPSPKKTSKVSDPSKVFSGNSKPTSKGSDDSDVNLRKALNILHDKHSTNKHEAVGFLQSKITDDIISELDI
jgi:hypothetical protein